ncbi:hypothetical protein L226DRAFT_616363 [Lentinus tigrinus ALCF2SS1-7]|uniref:uncharacterized protein n=1 Tax=Lentinus tigrinus ALCF2SS1-7 TaxID=1328758 RepID=UPI001165E926|nr:hypothetical protein L226DRAFT_616363 [Lentinus tigrinus ALCF2SS1-7]
MTIANEADKSILHLPEDVLVEIFFLAQDPWEDPWYRLLWVCRRWSTVGRRAPILWREIEIRERPNVGLIGTSLQNSTTIPIDVKFSETVDLAGSMALLAPHIGRNSPPLEELLLVFARSAPPRLDLDLFSPAYEEDTELFVWTPRVEQFPNLRSLTLGRAVSIQGPMPVFQTLRKLELHDFLRAPFTLPEFASFLLEHPHLEELSVRKYRPTLKSVPAPLALPATLRKFSLEDNAHYAKPFLSSFYIPPTVDVTLIRALDYMDHGDLGPNLGQIHLDVKSAMSATRLIPDDRSLLPILSLVNSVTLRREYESLHSIIGTTPSGNVVDLSGRAYDDAEKDLLDALRLLRDIVIIFSGAPIVELCIKSHGSSRMEEEDWALALNALPTLERLSVLGTGGGEWDARYTLLDALQYTPRKKTRGKNKRIGGSGRVPALWPQLKSLTFVSNAWKMEDEELAEALETCLKNRMERGSRLEELRLILKYIRRPDDWGIDENSDALDEEGTLDEQNSLDEENAQRRDIYSLRLQPAVGHLQLEFVNDW